MAAALVVDLAEIDPVAQRWRERAVGEGHAADHRAEDNLRRRVTMPACRSSRWRAGSEPSAR